MSDALSPHEWSPLFLKAVWKSAFPPVGTSCGQATAQCLRGRVCPARREATVLFCPSFASLGFNDIHTQQCLSNTRLLGKWGCIRQIPTLWSLPSGGPVSKLTSSRRQGTELVWSTLSCTSWSLTSCGPSVYLGTVAACCSLPTAAHCIAALMS